MTDTQTSRARLAGETSGSAQRPPQRLVLPMAEIRSLDAAGWGGGPAYAYAAAGQKGAFS